MKWMIIIFLITITNFKKSFYYNKSEYPIVFFVKKNKKIICKKNYYLIFCDV